jgi:hypothetical protein
MTQDPKDWIVGLLCLVFAYCVWWLISNLCREIGK